MKTIEYIQYESQTSGLWWRFVTRLLAGLGGVIIGLSFLYLYLGTLIDYDYFMLIAGFPTGIVVILLIFQKKPTKWNNTVTIDFKNEIFLIEHKKLFYKKSQILDFEGKKYTFQEIEQYSSYNFDSFIMSANYLVSFHRGDSIIKVIAFKNPDDYVAFTSILKDRLQMKFV